MKTSILLNLGFIAVGILCIYPWLMGTDSARIYKLIAGLALILFGLGSLIYELVKKR